MNKKKIIIITTSAGGGHISVSNAVNSYLKDEFDVETFHAFGHILAPLDVIHTFSRGRFSIPKFYDCLLQKKWLFFCNLLYQAGRWYFRLRRNKMEQLLATFIKKQNPDLIISVVPMINNAILNVVKEGSIVFFLIPTDLNTEAFLYGIKNAQYTQFYVSSAFDDQEIIQTFISVGIPISQITITGFPIRLDFFEKKDTLKIKEQYSIANNKPVMMLLMGASGPKAMYTFCKQLTKLTMPIHILICLGKNNNLRDKIKSINFPPHITITIISFTQRISDLMAVSDILITKSGSVTVCEAIYMHLPMLLDATSTVLKWEQFNHTFVKKHGFGLIINNLNQMLQQITELLSNKDQLSQMKKKMAQFEKKDAYIEIPKLIKNLLEKQSAP